MISVPTFLVCISDAFVAEDITGILLEAYPSARVENARSRDDALDRLAGLSGPVVAFVFMPPEAVSSTPLGQALTRVGARLVLMGNDAEERGENAGFRVLQRPFRAADLLALIED
ncbi:hypothetical protein Q4543_12730 [Salipiger sp. 1_MG-2023]|uniref:hypothetical protein n=1 Tax=Salipiger sp. 1_MG-2023 TaxID=3062665 RepID=UPI0026E33ADD|nr:hypothetical protein [Salipiger sp. 1_MG-2023]MDO6586380.1 hypothetical protein [Salipiger sp. 1_MG-2023]